jgi:hypothetical protein
VEDDQSNEQTPCRPDNGRPASLRRQFDGNGARGNYQRCVLDGDDKLIVDLFKDELFLELYRISDDVQEQNNLAFNEAKIDRVEYLLGLLRNHLRDKGDQFTIPDDAYTQFTEKYAKFHH